MSETKTQPGSEVIDATGHTAEPLHVRGKMIFTYRPERPSMERHVGTANIEADAKLWAAPHAPHVCDDATCPGNVNRQRLEAYEGLAENNDSGRLSRGDVTRGLSILGQQAAKALAACPD